MKRILVPVNFSKADLNAFEYGRMLFSSIPTVFYLLSTYVEQPLKVLGIPQEDNYGEWLNPFLGGPEPDLQELIKDSRKKNENAKHRFEALSIPGSFIHAINSTAIFKEIDFIVMGNKSEQSVKEVFLGRNAIKVINIVDYRPIIVVPRNYSVKRPEEIVFSTNFKRKFIKEELKPLLDLASFSKSKVQVVQLMAEGKLNAAQTANKEALKEILTGLDYGFHKVKVFVSETAALKDFAKYADADLISLVNHRYSFFQKLVRQSVVEKVAFDSPVPILLLPELN
jgi:nucleotide-binding universal stress UspA family protein